MCHFQNVSKFDLVIGKTKVSSLFVIISVIIRDIGDPIERLSCLHVSPEICCYTQLVELNLTLILKRHRR